jgi:DNA-binding response OmpR family regulator
VIDRDIHLARALLVEGNALLRSVAAEQLRSLGVGHVSQTSRVRDARLMIEREPFDIIICNREFEGSADSGQDLLDELRREHQMPHSTVFIMVTSQASYAQVVEAAEAALDGILIRPYTAQALSERLLEARQRKRELGDILRALDAGQTELAFARALKRFQEKQAYATYCGRLVAELLLRMQRPEDARLVFEKLAQPAGATWARLGMARALMAGGEVGGARKLIQSILASDPACADAHDLLGRILVEQCDFGGALEQYREAAAITPGCLLRTQHAGALAFYQGQGAEALKTLERAVGLGVQSKLFDALTLLLMAALRHDNGDKPGVQSMREQLLRYRERFPDSRRLARFCEAVEVLVALVAGQTDKALTGLRALTGQALDDDFDLEAANTVLVLWARVPTAERPAAEHAAAVERIAMRFSVSKAIAEVLLASARREEPALGIVRSCQARVAALAEEAMDRALKGHAGEGVRALLAAGEQALNAKLLEMAALMARRHQDQIADAESLAEQAGRRLARSCQAVNHIAGIQRSGRSPGGLQLRVRQDKPADVATA